MRTATKCNNNNATQPDITLQLQQKQRMQSNIAPPARLVKDKTCAGSSTHVCAQAGCKTHTSKYHQQSNHAFASCIVHHLASIDNSTVDLD